MSYNIYELYTLNFSGLKYIVNNIKIYIRILHICYILIESYIEFKYNNLILYFKKKELNKRLEFIKNSTKKLENLNIVYIKIFQSLCLNDDILCDEEKNYLLKYTDTVPYLFNDIDTNILS